MRSLLYGPISSRRWRWYSSSLRRRKSSQSGRYCMDRLAHGDGVGIPPRCEGGKSKFLFFVTGFGRGSFRLRFLFLSIGGGDVDYFLADFSNTTFFVSFSLSALLDEPWSPLPSVSSRREESGSVRTGELWLW